MGEDERERAGRAHCPDGSCAPQELADLSHLSLGDAGGRDQCPALHRVDASIGGAPASVGVLLRENLAVDNDNDASRGDSQAHANDDAATNDLRHGNLLEAMRGTTFWGRCEHISLEREYYVGRGAWR